MKKETFAKGKWIYLLCLGMAAFYFMCAAYINFSGRPKFYCTDMYADMLYAQKAWEGKTLFPENWVFGNQLYVVATPVLAALAMPLFGDPQSAMAFAATAYGVLVVLGLMWMVKPIMKPNARLICVVLFMAIPLYFGDPVFSVNGWQLLFTMCSYYACYALTAFLAFGCYIRSDWAHSWTFYLILTITCLLSFGTGMQSLRQTAIMTLPLLAMECLRILLRIIRKEKPIAKSSWIALWICTANGLGVLAKRMLDVRQMEIFGQVGLAFSPASIVESIKTLVSLFLTREGGTTWMLAGLTVVSVAALVIWGKEILAKRDTTSAILLGGVVLSVLAIAAADLITTMEVRGIYYFMLIPLMSICMAKSVEIGKIGAKTGVLILMALLVLSSVRVVTDYCMQAYFKKYDNHYEVSDYLRQQGITTIYSQWNLGEKVAIASDFTIKAGFWDVIPYISVPYLCDPGVYAADPSEVAYLFGENFESGIEAAESRGVQLKEEAYFPESGIHVFSASERLMDPVENENA